MKKKEVRAVSMMVAPRGEPIFSEFATTISYDDEAGGEFLAIEQSTDAGEMKVVFDFDEWELIDSTVRKMIGASKEWADE